MKPNFLKQIAKDFPKSFPIINEKNMVREELISPFVVQLPQAILKDAQNFVKNVYDIKERTHYQDQLPETIDLKSLPKTPSILCCFDFHYSKTTGLKLIEINTNASLYIEFCLLRKIHNLPDFPNALDDLWESFEHTYQEQTQKKPTAIAILDEQPEQEGLYFEFLLFQEWFSNRGIDSQILSLEDYNRNCDLDFIYNRFTDFYLDRDGAKKLLNDYKTKEKVLSPNPRDYFLMADKKRLPLLRSYKELEKFIPETMLFSQFKDQDELWAQRKKFFFKPSQSFGSKAVYQGKSISKTNFYKIYSPNFIAQEFIPPGRLQLSHKGEDFEMKYDLRFYSFNGPIQNAGARLYRGQTTNMKTPMGGLAPISFS